MTAQFGELQYGSSTIPVDHSGFRDSTNAVDSLWYSEELKFAREVTRRRREVCSYTSL
jgi:hypothetical protein